MAKGHSRGAAGGWKHGRTSSVTGKHGTTEGYSVGPQNVALDGSNYRGAGGASWADITRVANRAEKAGKRVVTVATLIRRTSQNKGFRWFSSTMTIDEFQANITLAQGKGMSVNDFASSLHDTDYPVQGALTWTLS